MKSFIEKEREIQEKLKTLKPLNETYHEAFLNRVYNSKREEIKNPDILIVNDDLSIICLVDAYLKSKGITSKGITDGRGVLKELEHYHPKVVVLDEILPDIGGWNLFKQIKSNPKLNNIPIFIFCHEELIEYHLDCKVDGYIPYPFNFSDFDAIINLVSER